MPKQKLLFRHWMVENGPIPPAELPSPELDLISLDDSAANVLSTDHLASSDTGRTPLVQLAVRSALARLTDDERELIELYYFHGHQLPEIARMSNRTFPRLNELHKRAIRRLRKELGPMVATLFDIFPEPARGCVVCASPHRPQIDQLLASRDRTRPWSDTLRIIRSRFDLVIKTPQTLIGHERYH